MAELPLNICLTCSKSYKRQEHLRRHQLSHSTKRPFQCELCNSTFQRTDVLKRHLNTCDPGNLPEPRFKKPALPNSLNPSEPVPVSSEGRESIVPQLSINDQALLQDSFDGPPFGHMVGWITGGISNLPPSDPSDSIWQELLNLNSGIQSPCSNADAGIDDLKSLNFLDNFTSKTGLVCSFDCGTIDQRLQIAAELAKSTSTISFTTSFVDAAGFEVGETETSRIDLHNWLSDPLSLKSHEIVNYIKDVVLLKSNQSPVTLIWSQLVHELCLQFFSPENLRKYLEFYWAIWHPNVNLIHRPTFNPLTSKPVLIAAMSLIGACVSPDYNDVDGAKRWFNCVEEMVFNDRDLCDDSLDSFSQDSSEAEWRRKLQSLQAAYIVCLFQNWEGTDKSKRRIRRYRYSTVVAAARDIGLENARHPDYSQQDLCEFLWIRFVVREELIRVFLWIFLLDTAFVIFNNLPPRMVIREMKMGMACPEACFQSTSSEECFKELQHNSRPPKLGFSSAVEMLYQDNIDLDLSVTLAHLGPLNLFAMTSALHSHIFHHQNTFSCQETLEPIRRALDNWRKSWHVYMTQLSSSPQHSPVADHNLSHTDMWKRVGFMRHASEYWLLANLMVKHLSAPTEDEIEIIEIAVSVQSPSSRAINNSINPLLDKVDETSMRQVNILISDFQKVGIR